MYPTDGAPGRPGGAAAAPSGAAWRFTRAGRTYGPTSFGRLRLLAAAGRLGTDDLVIPVGGARWTPARLVPGLFDDPPAAARPRRLHWWLLPPAGGVAAAIVLSAFVLADTPRVTPPGPLADTPPSPGADAPGSPGKPPPPPEPADAAAYVRRAVGRLRQADYAGAAADCDAAIRRDPDWAEPYRLRAFAEERLGRADAAAADFAAADHIAERRLADAPPPHPGDRVVALRPTAVLSKGAKSVLRELLPGQELTATGVLGKGDAAWVQAEVDYRGERVAGFVVAQDVAAEWGRPAGAVAPADEKELPALLTSAFDRHEYVVVNVGAPAAGQKGSLFVSATRYGPEDGPNRGKEPKPWVCEVRTRAGWREAARVLIEQAGYLQATAEERPVGLGFDADHALRLFYRLPPHRFPPAGRGEHVFLSRQAQQYLRLVRAADDAGDRAVLIFNEPHADRARQFALFRGLEELFADNPHLTEGGRTAFLAEGLPAGRAASLQPLRDAEPKPSDDLVRDVLDTYLIPGHTAFEWKHNRGVVVEGHEDPDLYRLSARLWAEVFNPDRALVKVFGADAPAQRLWLQAVAARNRATSRALLDQLEKRPYPMLFVGARHLDGLADKEKLTDAEWDGSAGLLEAADLARLRAAEKRGVGDYLRDAHVGYTFLDPASNPFPDAATAAAEARQYLALFRAQASGRLDDYLDKYVRAGRGTTTAPDVPGAAGCVRPIREWPPDEGKQDGYPRPTPMPELTGALFHLAEQLPPDGPGGGKPPHDWDHIFNGGWKTNEKGEPEPVGYHHRPGGQDKPNRELKPEKNGEIAKPPDANGVYGGNVEFTDPETGKKVKKYSTFFPDDWTPERVKEEVEKAFGDRDKVNGDKWEGTSPSGVRIRGTVGPDGAIETAYPVYQPKAP
jgi:hypothetical protein